MRPRNHATTRPCDRATMRPRNHATTRPCDRATMRPRNHATTRPCDRATTRPCNHSTAMHPRTMHPRAAAPPSHNTTLPPSHNTTLPPSHRPTAPPSHRPTVPPSHHLPSTTPRRSLLPRYTAVTHMFIHADLAHLFNNSLSLAVTGYRVFSHFGYLSFYTVFFGGGVYAAVHKSTRQLQFMNQVGRWVGGRVGESGRACVISRALAPSSLCTNPGCS